VFRIADPLTVFLEAHRHSLPPTRGQKRFNAGEHAWLGSHGAERACDELLRQRNLRVSKDLFAAIRRAHGREELQYGELVALSGDFYDSPQALFEEQPAALPWLWEDNDLSDLREIFQQELQWIEARQQGQGSPVYPDKNLRLAWNAKAYVELALRNTDHFGWHNVCAYVRHHGEALRLAASCRGREDETWRRALYTNAFADHFLTDGFAAGHIRIPRAEILAWAEDRGFSEKVAGALSKLLHDQDGHVGLDSLHGVVDENCRTEGDGLRVQDSTGTSWSTRCDGQLFLDCGATSSPLVDRAVSAVTASVLELLLAWQLGELPPGTFAATALVPFPHPAEPRLIDKFASAIVDADLDRLWNSVAWYAKIPWIAGLKRQHIRDLFLALPEIMSRFRATVAAVADANAELRVRVHPAYLAAYRVIS
jgi:hypothetical protein